MSVVPQASATSRSRPSALPPLGGTTLERFEKSRVDRVDRQPPLAPRLLIAGEAKRCSTGGQLAEPVAELDPGRVELEALRQPRVFRLPPRERGLRRRIVGEKHGVEAREPGLHLVDEQRKKRSSSDSAIASVSSRATPANRAKASQTGNARTGRSVDRRLPRRIPAGHGRNECRCRPSRRPSPPRRGTTRAS